LTDRVLASSNDIKAVPQDNRISSAYRIGTSYLRRRNGGESNVSSSRRL